MIELVTALLTVGIVAFVIIKEVLEALQPHLVKMADVVGGFILSLLETVVEIFEVIKPTIILVAEFINNVLSGIIKGLQVAMDWVVSGIKSIINFFTGGEVFAKAGEVLGNSLKAAGSFISSSISGISDFFTGEEELSTDDIELLQGIFLHTQAISMLLKEEFADSAEDLADRIRVNDVIITKDGKIIETSPSDNIYAFEGRPGIFEVKQPSLEVRSDESSTPRPRLPVVDSNEKNQFGFVGQPNVTNNQTINQSNSVINNHMLPISEFMPVGV